MCRQSTYVQSQISVINPQDAQILIKCFVNFSKNELEIVQNGVMTATKFDNENQICELITDIFKENVLISTLVKLLIIINNIRSNIENFKSSLSEEITEQLMSELLASEILEINTLNNMLIEKLNSIQYTKNINCIFLAK